MAKVFYVSYDLLGEDRNYDDLTEQLRKWRGKNILKSVWAIVVQDNDTCASIKGKLVRLLDEKDGIIVIEPVQHSHRALLETTYKLPQSSTSGTSTSSSQ